MKIFLYFFQAFIFVSIICFVACTKSKETRIIKIKHFPIDNIEKIITKSYVTFDSNTSSDGSGSLKIHAKKPITIRLFELGDIDLENAVLNYQAKVRTQNLRGTTYLEMWCSFPGKGEYFSRDLKSPLEGTNDWSEEITPFFLKKGENPDNVKLNIVVDGTGTVWIDDIRVTASPLMN
jgi:hypothetical protein